MPTQKQLEQHEQFDVVYARYRDELKEEHVHIRSRFSWSIAFNAAILVSVSIVMRSDPFTWYHCVLLLLLAAINAGYSYVALQVVQESQKMIPRWICQLKELAEYYPELDTEIYPLLWRENHMLDRVDPRGDRAAGWFLTVSVWLWILVALVCLVAFTRTL